MSFLRYNFSLLLIFLFALTSCNRDSAGEKIIKEKTKAYEHAFNKKDAKALSILWAEDAEYIDPESGEVLKGRAAIEDRFISFFKNRPDTTLEIKTGSITFPNDNEAVETSTAVIKQKNEVISQTAYKAFYEKYDGNWLITELREVKFSDPPQPSQHLKELEWLIGDWIDEDDDSSIASHYEWDKYKNFITQRFSVTVEGTFELEGKQIIGWDPIKKRIRSWIFDSDGAFGEGNWKKSGDKWIVETSSTLTDGRRASAINIFTPVNDNEYTWQSTGRAVGAELLPDVDPVTVTRIKK